MDDSTQRGGSRETLIADALSAVFDILASSPRSAHVRELQAQARSYTQAIKHWTTVAPTYAQLDAMFELVIELHARAIATKKASA